MSASCKYFPRGCSASLLISDPSSLTTRSEAEATAYPGAAYGLVIQNVLMLYRTDELGTNGEALHFQHWADIVDCGYSWYRQNKVGGTTNANINSASK